MAICAIGWSRWTPHDVTIWRLLHAQAERFETLVILCVENEHDALKAEN